MIPKIAWIASYPKSGNTMVRLFLASYFYTNDGILNDFRPLKKISAFNNLEFFRDIDNCPEIEHFIKKPEIISKYWQKAQININEKIENNIIFLKTHNAQLNFESNFFTNKNLTKCFIYIVRDPRSVLISSMSHYGINNQEDAKNHIISDKRLTYANTSNRLPEFLLSWKSNFITWQNFYIKNPDIGMIVRYEDLVLNKKDIFLKILNFILKKLNFEIDLVKFENSLNSIDFKKLQEIEKVNKFVEKGSHNNNFFRKGKIDEWKELLDKKIEKDLFFSFEREMKYLGYL